jgi:hypothetical protein
MSRPTISPPRTLQHGVVLTGVKATPYRVAYGQP